MTTINVQQIADNIRRLRESLYYSQEYMGLKLGIGQNAYSKIELGKCKLTVERLLGIANVLQTDLYTLIDPQINTPAAEKVA